MIDSDPTISREDFVPAVLHAMEDKSSSLYQLWPEFTIYAYAEPAVFVGDMKSWIPNELYRICEEKPELTVYGRQESAAFLISRSLA